MRVLPNKLQLDLLRRHAGPFLFCFLTIMFLLLMQFLVLYINQLIGKDLPVGVIIELILTNLAYMVVLAAPMAVLVASLMAFGRFTELNELTALRAAGINPIHVINPVLFVSALMAVSLIWFSNEVLPDSNQRAKALFVDIKLQKPSFDLNPGEFFEGIQGYTFLVEDIGTADDSLFGVTLFQEPTSRRKKAVIRAERGQLTSQPESQTATLHLNKGTILRYLDRIEEGQRTEVLERTRFDRYRISFDLSELAFNRSDPESQSRNDRTMNIESMLAVVDSLHQDIDRERSTLYHRGRFTAPRSDNGTDSEPEPRRRTVDQMNESELDPPYESGFLALNRVDWRHQQDRVHEDALAALRNYESTYENVIVNTEWRDSRVARYLVEVHKKFSIPIACVIFVLLGATIGMYSRKGNLGYAALIGAVFLTFYWISIIQGEKLADRMYVSPFVGMWFADLVLAAAGIWLTLRICTSFRISNLWRRDD